MCESKEKLIEILRDNDVRISKKGNIRLSDFVNNIIESKNSNLYIKRLTGYDKILIGDEYYINPTVCIEILNKTNFKKCKDICAKIQIIDEDGESIIDVENQIFQFENHKFLAFFIEKDDGDWDVWIKGSEVAKFLEYVDKDKAIRDHVDDDNKLSFFKLKELFGSAIFTLAKSLDRKTIFINLSGFFNLIHLSKKPTAKKIKKWLDNDVLPALIKHGTYTTQPEKLKIDFFYDESTFSDYDKQAVLYLGYVGKYKGEYIFKYGLSRDMFRRDYKEHRKTFDRFKVIFIGKCDNCELVESLFGKELKLRYVHRELVINKKSQTELFTITTKYTYKYFIELLQNLIETNKLPAIKEAHTQISNLSNVLDSYKQSDKLRELELQYRLSENYKLELQTDARITELESKRDVRIKELDLETQTIVKNLDIKLQREKNKQIAMEKGYDLTCLGYSVVNRSNPTIIKEKKKGDVISI